MLAAVQITSTYIDKSAFVVSSAKKANIKKKKKGKKIVQWEETCKDLYSVVSDSRLNPDWV